MFTDKYGNVINDNSPKELDNAEITGVSTGVGNINNVENNTHTERNAENNTDNIENDNTGNTETNNTQE